MCSLIINNLDHNCNSIDYLIDAYLNASGNKEKWKELSSYLMIIIYYYFNNTNEFTKDCTLTIGNCPSNEGRKIIKITYSKYYVILRPIDLLGYPKGYLQITKIDNSENLENNNSRKSINLFIPNNNTECEELFLFIKNI